MMTSQPGWIETHNGWVVARGAGPRIGIPSHRRHTLVDYLVLGMPSFVLHSLLNYKCI